MFERLQGLHRLAKENLSALRNNIYPGRGLAIGMDEAGKNFVQVYWIMGRSNDSRNRLFVEAEEYGWVRTAAADPSKVKDPSLIIYLAVAERRGLFVVSNGAQTEPVLNDYLDTFGLKKALQDWKYEPDAPNFTPRITGVLTLQPVSPQGEIAVLKRSPDSDECICESYQLNFHFGLSHCVTTYTGDGSPLPSFEGAPYVLPIGDSIEEIAQTYWDALNPDNRVSLVVKTIDRSTAKSEMRIVNKYEAVVA